MAQFFADLQPRSTAMPRPRYTVSGITGGAKAYFLARLFVEGGVSLLVVTPDVHQRDVLYEDLQSLLAGMPDAAPRWQGLESVVCRYLHQAPPSTDSVTFQQHQALVSYQPLWRLLGDDPVLVVMAAESLAYRVLPPQQLQSCLLAVHIGASFSLSQLATALVERGYRRVSMVEAVGEFALRGGILDVFSPGQTHPIRIEFFGEDVESIRAFDVQSQTSTATLHMVVIAPVFPLSRQQGQRLEGTTRLCAYLATQGWSEASITASLERWQEQSPASWPWGVAPFFYETLCAPLAYLPATGLLCGVDVEELSLTLAQLPPPDPMRLGETTVALPEDHLLPHTAIMPHLQDRLDVAMRRYDTPDTVHTATLFRPQGTPQFFGGLERFIAQVRQWQDAAWCIVVLCHSALEVRRMQTLCASYSLPSRSIATSTAVLSDDGLRPGALLLSVGHLSQGFVWPEMRLVVLRHADIFGEKKQEQPPAARRRPSSCMTLPPCVPVTLSCTLTTALDAIGA